MLISLSCLLLMVHMSRTETGCALGDFTAIRRQGRRRRARKGGGGRLAQGDTVACFFSLSLYRQGTKIDNGWGGGLVPEDNSSPPPRKRILLLHLGMRAKWSYIAGWRWTRGKFNSFLKKSPYWLRGWRHLAGARGEHHPNLQTLIPPVWVCMNHLTPLWSSGLWWIWTLLVGCLEKLRSTLGLRVHDGDDGVFVCQRLGLCGQGESSFNSTGLQSPSFWLMWPTIPSLHSSGML